MLVPAVVYKTTKETPMKAADLNVSSVPIAPHIEPASGISVKIPVLAFVDQTQFAPCKTTFQLATACLATPAIHSELVSTTSQDQLPRRQLTRVDLHLADQIASVGK